MTANPKPSEIPTFSVPAADATVLVVTAKSLTITTEDGGQKTLYRGDRIKGDYYMAHLKRRSGVAVETALDNLKSADKTAARRTLIIDRLTRSGVLPNAQTIHNRRSGGLPIYPTGISAEDVNFIALESTKGPDHRSRGALALTNESGTAPDSTHK